MSNRVSVTQDSVRKLFREAPMQAALDATADAIKQEIENQSPVNVRHARHYQDSIRIRRFPTSRRIYTIDYFGHIIEWGGPNVQGPGGGAAIVYAPFRRAVRALKLKFVELGKGGGRG